MARITLSLISKKDTKQILSAEELKQKYLFGLPLEKDGVAIPDDLFEWHIAAAKEQLESLLNIKFNRQVIKEQKDFFHDDWVQWSYVKASYPVVYPIALRGYLGTTKQVDYPREWLSARATSDGKLYSRILYMVPTHSSATSQNNMIFTGMAPNMNWFASKGGSGQIPSYWNMEYLTGFEKVPADIVHVIAMLASVQALAIVSDMMMGNNHQTGMQGTGVGWGINSKSISIDGLSQSVSSGAMNGIFSARIKQYLEQLGDLSGRKQGELSRLVNYYSDMTWGVA